MCKGVDCRAAEADDVFAAASAEAARLGVADERCRVARGGCYGLCKDGPNVVLRWEDPAKAEDILYPGNARLLYVPGEFHYPHMTEEKVRRVVAEHVAGGRPVAALLDADS